MEATIKIQKLGGGLGINFPSAIVNGLSLRDGLYVNVREDGNRIIIHPARQNVSYDLASMLNEITDKNIHHCVETGAPVGNEIW